MRYFIVVAVMAVSQIAAANACVQFGADQPAVGRVQVSWAPAERAMRAGAYAKALKELRATSTMLPSIHNAFTRRCVAEGANMRIASASAGETFLARHPSDRPGAKAAADRAWRTFPMKDNCP